MPLPRTAGAALLALLLGGLAAAAAEGRAARCFTTDEGAYPCHFRVTAPDGSFAISAPGKPGYLLDVEAPGVAFAFVALGGRNVALPGRYRRSRNEPGCWVGDETKAKICAW